MREGGNAGTDKLDMGLSGLVVGAGRVKAELDGFCSSSTLESSTSVSEHSESVSAALGVGISIDFGRSLLILRDGEPKLASLFNVDELSVLLRKGFLENGIAVCLGSRPRRPLSTVHAAFKLSMLCKACTAALARMLRRAASPCVPSMSVLGRFMGRRTVSE